MKIAMSFYPTTRSILQVSIAIPSRMHFLTWFYTLAKSTCCTVLHHPDFGPESAAVYRMSFEGTHFPIGKVYSKLTAIAVSTVS